VRTAFGLEAVIMNDPVSATPLVVPIGRHRREEHETKGRLA
jgi:hypothetical protein